VELEVSSKKTSLPLASVGDAALVLLPGTLTHGPRLNLLQPAKKILDFLNYDNMITLSLSLLYLLEQPHL
jgi:hypothetical protein